MTGMHLHDHMLLEGLQQAPSRHQVLRLRETQEVSSAAGLPIMLPLTGDPQFIACPNHLTKQLVCLTG